LRWRAKEREPNGALITLRESPSHGLEINRNPKEEKLEEKGKLMSIDTGHRERKKEKRQAVGRDTY
jgi:hypothetical protein